MYSDLNINVVIINWSRVAAKCKIDPIRNDPRGALIARFSALGLYITSVLRCLLALFDYDVSNIELVTDNIAAHIAHESESISISTMCVLIADIFICNINVWKIVGKRMALEGKLLDKIWAINPEHISFLSLGFWHRLNVHDAAFVEVLLINDAWLDRLDDKPIGHMIFYVSDRRVRNAQLYKYALDSIYKERAHPADYCETAAQAKRGHCPSEYWRYMSGEPKRSPAIDNTYRYHSVQLYLVAQAA